MKIKGKLILVITFSVLILFQFQIINADKLPNCNFYNAENTIVKNECDIKGYIYRTKVFKEYALIFTSESTYITRGNQCNRYDIKGRYMGIYDNKIFLLDEDKNEDDSKKYILITLSLSNGEINRLSLDDSIVGDKENTINEGVIDSNGNIYYLIKNIRDGSSEIVKWDKEGNLKKIIIPGMKNKRAVNLKCDNNNVIWFGLSKAKSSEDCLNSIDSIIRLETNYTSKIYSEFRGYVRDFSSDGLGNLWVIQNSNKELIKVNLNGDIKEKITGNYMKSIDIDIESNCWVVDNNLIKKVYKDKLQSKYEVTNSYK